MSKVFEFVDKALEQAYLGATAFWVVICAASANIFMSQIKKLAQVFVKSLGDAFWYKVKLETDLLIDNKLKSFEEKIIKNFDDKIGIYKEKKHETEGELLEYKEAIKLSNVNENELTFIIKDNDRFNLLRNLNKENV